MQQYRLSLALTLILIYVAAWIIQVKLFLNWDVGHLLHATELLLAGGSYTHDFFIPNPPLILYLYTPPVLAYKYLGLNIILGFRLYMFILASLALGLCYPLTQKIFHKEDSLLSLLFLIMLACVIFLLPLYDFGQRDYLFLIFALPYMLFMCCRLQKVLLKPSLAIAVGVLAFFGFGIKPQFLITPFLLELYYLSQTRRLGSIWRPEILVLAALLFIYTLTSFLLYPDYIYVIIPYVLRNYYGSVGSSHRDLYLNTTAIFCYLSLLFYGFQYRSDRYKKLNAVLLVAMLGFLYSYFAQQTTFYYHLIPGLSVACLLFFLGFAQFALKAKPSCQDYIAMAIPLVIMLIYLCCVVVVAWVMFIFAPWFSLACFALMFGLLLLLVQQQRNLVKALLSLFILMSLGILVYYLAHVTPGFTAHQFSITALSLLFLFGLLAARQRQGLGANLFLALLTFSLFAYPLFFCYCVYWRSVDYKERVVVSLTKFMAAEPRARSIYAFSIAGYISSPLAYYSGARLAQRMDCLWPIISTLKLTRQPDKTMHAKTLTAQQSADDNFFINLIADDLYQQKPDLVFVDRKTRYIELDQHFDYLVYLSRNQKFREEWQHYHFVKELAGGAFYRLGIYERIKGNEDQKERSR